jgi:transcriptional regulator with XRE-family HTH domain
MAEFAWRVLRERRTALGLTLRQVEAATHIDKGRLSRLERGKFERDPTGPESKALARVLQTNEADLWLPAGEDSPPRPPERRAGASDISALRLIFAALSTRPAAQQLDVVRLEQADRYHEVQPHLVDALEANIVLALRLLGAYPLPPAKSRKRNPAP